MIEVGNGCSFGRSRNVIPRIIPRRIPTWCRSLEPRPAGDVFVTVCALVVNPLRLFAVGPAQTVTDESMRPFGCERDRSSVGSIRLACFFTARAPPARHVAASRSSSSARSDAGSKKPLRR
jgi:hypothetical protein